MEFQEVYRRYRPELQQVEAILLDQLRVGEDALTESSGQLIRAGGKRIRPLFALICSRFGDPASDRTRVLRVAAALEMVHMATLVHDDVVDDASLRRGQPTVRVRFGNRPAMYTGDFLFAKSIQLLTTVERPDVHRDMARAMVRICQGEIDQIRDLHNWRQTLRDYLRRIERKTALLISVSCQLGAKVAGAPADVVRTLRRFGYYTGMAFQMIDDVLDYVGDERVVGKRVGGDLMQGNLTLPALYAAQQAGHGKELAQLLSHPPSAAEVAKAVDIVKESGAIAYVQRLADRYREKAIAVLAGLEDRVEREELAVVAAFVNGRAY
ncbi:MAG: polyprenyl synthetase family protein [Alicyclobacillus macrosporangiidus]|uniref:polyprenyl synthetase family protein n=1 Tax=Alicyclobacillus macrosporangiidus TaxID=392015 RepID=UPI0026F2109E|nr:polyprenyl synthetase family protein [Alicyclobacillus macrosporangiidus]MCL6598417.1 polyprenyl synthetase family protein [Alicyclobacillus macrosporangiidus]